MGIISFEDAVCAIIWVGVSGMGLVLIKSRNHLEGVAIQ